MVGCSWKGGAVTDPIKDCYFAAKLKSSSPNWTVGLDYRANRNLMVYAKVTRG